MGRLVLVEWVDSWSSYDSHWEEVSLLNENLTPVRSVGWIVQETDKSLVVCPHLDHAEEGEGNTFGWIGIPKSAVRSIKQLKAIDDGTESKTNG